MLRFANVRIVALALALATSLAAPSMLLAQSSLLVARGSLRGWLLTWTPFTGALTGEAAATARFGSIHVVAEGEEWRGTFFNDQQALYSVSADERALRFNAETFWMDADQASDLLEQFGGAAGAYVQQSSALWQRPSSIFDTRGNGGGSRGAGESRREDAENGDAHSNDASEDGSASGPWIGRDETPAFVVDAPSVGPLLRDAPPTFANAFELTVDAGAPAAALETTVPEPSTYVLVGTGLLAMLALSRRRARPLARAGH